MADQQIQGREHLVDRRVGIEAVDLVEVDRLHAQPPQAGLATLLDVLARKALHVRPFAHAAEDLGGQHHLLQLGVLPQGLAGDLFAHAHRVHVGGVEEVDAGLDGLAEEGHGRLFVQDPRPPLGVAIAHAAQAEAGDFDAGAAEIGVLHGP